MKNFDDAVWKLTASLILMKPNVDERQLFTLTRAPVILFQADAMRTIGNFNFVHNQILQELKGKKSRKKREKKLGKNRKEKRIN